MKYRVIFTPEAQADLLELYDYVAARGGGKGPAKANEGSNIPELEMRQLWATGGTQTH